MSKAFERLLQILPLQQMMLGTAARRYDELGRERGQAAIRVMIVFFGITYLVIRHYPMSLKLGPPLWLVFLVGYLAVSVAILVLTLQDTVVSARRRLATNIADIVAVTYAMISTGEAGIPLFVLYLWITLGNRLRFGRKGGVISALLSVVGFCLVLGLSTAWKQFAGVAAAVVAALVLIPTFSIRSMREGTMSNSSARSSTRQPFLKRMKETGELGQALIRVLICSVVFVYLVARHHPILSLEPWLVFCFGYLAFSAIIAALLLVDPRPSVVRRIAVNVADVSATSYLIVALGNTGLPLFVLYLWITLGNGFRFGVNALLVGTALSVAGFSTVVIVSESWREQATLAAGMLIGLIVIPAYAAHLIRQLHEARRRAEEASAAKSHFLARMSHELRTPLNGILGTTELLGTSKRLTREDRSLLEVIRDSVKVSMRQIDNVLDFSKIEAGKLVIEQTKFDLHELLNRAVRLVRANAFEKNLRLILRIDPAIPYWLAGDTHHLDEVLLNLLSNAIKFTEKGYVSLEAHLIVADENSVLVRIEVHDTGIGIEPAAIDRIFDAFAQEDSGTTRRYGGTGLGTTIARQLVELMGGNLGVHSIKGKGSTFYAEIRFPRAPDAVDDSSDAIAGMRVLLISKDAALIRAITARTDHWNITLNVVPSAGEAEGLLARGIRLGNPLHAVLADSQAVLTNAGIHCAGEFLGKAALSSTPVFLLCDVSPEAALLRQWGYAGVLSYDVPRNLLFNALRWSGAYEAAFERGVVQVEPWAWGKSPSQPGRIRPRLLIADDNKTNLMILRKTLESANYEVDTALSGDQALAMLQAGRYKAAILDMHMPGLDGIEVIKEYQKSQRYPKVPIIMLTANATIEAQMESADAGAHAYLTKPFTTSIVLNTVEKVLEEAEVFDIERARGVAPSEYEVPALDTEVITELDRLYKDPKEVAQLMDTFEAESRRLLDELAAAVHTKNHAAFCEGVHALKGNGANVGAMRLVQACSEVEGFSLIEFRREGKEIVARLEVVFAEA
ncbi:MAG: response regulator, partial [Sulfurifustis sp.]